MADTTATQPVIDAQPDPKTLAVGAADMATPTTEPTPLTSGMVVVTTPQGKASVDVNAPEGALDAFNAAAEILVTPPLRGKPANNKGAFVVQHAMVSTKKGDYVAGDFVAPGDLTDDERDMLLDVGALAKP